MEPSWSNFKKFLRHEEFAQANNSALQHLSNNLQEFENVMASLAQRMDTKFRDFEATLATLSRRMDDLEMDIQ
jgi:Zn-dependent oligopeptidase